MTQSSQLRHRRRGDKRASQGGGSAALEASRRRRNSDDKNLILGKYKTLEEVPREVGLSREEHAKWLKKELRHNPWKYSVRAVSSLELMLVGLMVILPSLVYGLIILKLPGLKYKMPSASQTHSGL